MLNEGKMRCGGCGCDEYSQHKCQQSFCRSLDCGDNLLTVKGPVIGTGIDPAGYTNVFPIKSVQESPCYWNLEISNVSGSSVCSTAFNQNFVIPINGSINFCDYYEELTPLADSNMVVTATSRMFLAGDNPLHPGSGIYDGSNTFYPASGNIVNRPKIWHEFKLNAYGATIENAYGVGNNVYFTKYYYARSNIVYSGDFNAYHSIPATGLGQSYVTVPTPDCNSFYNTGSINCNTLDITFSGYRMLYEEAYNYPTGHSGCFFCNLDNMNIRIYPYMNSPVDTYSNTSPIRLSGGPDYQSSVHVSGGFQDILITFSGIISESDIANSSNYNKGTCDCSFLNRTFKEYQQLIDNTVGSDTKICCECSGSPCLNLVYGHFDSYSGVVGQPSYNRASRLTVELISDYGIYASFQKDFTNWGSGSPIPIDPTTTLQSLNIPYVSGVSDQHKCYASSGLCTISVVQPLHYLCSQYDGCESFCDRKGPNEVLVNIPANFYSVLPKATGTYHSSAFSWVDYKVMPVCHASGRLHLWSFLTDTPLFPHYDEDGKPILETNCLGSATLNFPPFNIVTNTDVFQTEWLYTNCQNYINQMLSDATGPFLLDKISECSYQYSGVSNPKYWELAFIDLNISDMVYLTVTFGNGSYYKDGVHFGNASYCRSDYEDTFEEDSSISSGFCGSRCLYNDFYLEFPFTYSPNVPPNFAPDNSFFNVSGIISVEGIT